MVVILSCRFLLLSICAICANSPDSYIAQSSDAFQLNISKESARVIRSSGDIGQVGDTNRNFAEREGPPVWRGREEVAAPR